MRRIETPAFIAAVIGPFQSVGGWLLAGSLWPGYDPVTKTISDLAAKDSPVWPLMSAFFLLGGTLTLLAAVYSKSFPMPGRVVLFSAALATYGLTIFQTPTQDTYSVAHRFFAATAFVLWSIWPIFATRRDLAAPMLLRPKATILATGFFLLLAIWFLSVWTDPNFTAEGVAERILVTAQALYMSLAIVLIWFEERRLYTKQ